MSGLQQASQRPVRSRYVSRINESFVRHRRWHSRCKPCWCKAMVAGYEPSKRKSEVRMPRMRAIIERRKVPDQPQPPNRPPSHIFNQSVVGDRVGRDHHGAARELAVVKRQKQTAPHVEFPLTLHPYRKRAPVEPRQRKKNGQQIPEPPQRQKPPVPQRRHIRRKPHTQQIREVDLSVFVRQSQNIARPRTPRLQRLHRMFQTARAGSST